MTETKANDVNQVGFWEQIYDEEVIPGWDIGQPAPPFVAYLDRSDAPEAGQVAVIGCGRGNDVLLFAEKGFEVTAVDFSAPAIQAELTLISGPLREEIPERHWCHIKICASVRPVYILQTRQKSRSAPGNTSRDNLVASRLSIVRPMGCNPGPLHQYRSVAVG